MTLSTDVESVVVESIDESIREVFEMMAGATITRTPTPTDVERSPHVSQRNGDDQGLSVAMGLTGGLEGNLFLCMSSLTAIRWAHSLIDHEATEVDQTVIDAIGELGNMVVGGAKRRMSAMELVMSLPSVVRVSRDDIVFRTGMNPTEVSYDFEGSTITVLISLQKIASDIA